MKNFIRNNMFVVPLVSVLAIGISGSAVVWNTTHPAQIVVPPPPAQASTVSWTKTPAADAIRTAISSIPKDWTRRGDQLTSVTPPFPLSCNVGGVQSAFSVSQGYNNGTTVALASYTAGTGALAFKTQRDNSGACVEANTAVSNVSETGIGSEAFTIQVRRGLATSQTTVFRRGDVIGYVLVDGGASASPAHTVDTILSNVMGNQCINEKSTTDDAKRTLWSGVPFTGLLTEKQATIEAWSLPSTPSVASYKATPIPAQIGPVQPVTMPTVPDYPVWPKLPAEQKLPEVPQAPAPAATTTKTVLNRVPDDSGPGCGWAFTGTVAPTFNQSEVDASNNSIIKAAQDELTKNAQDWSKSVLAYWEAVDNYTKSVSDYEKFRTEVASVSDAWKPISDQWKAYYTSQANYDNAVKAHDAFVAQKADAQKSYDAAVQVCNAPDPVQTPQPTQTATAPSSSPSNTAPTTTATPSPTAAPAAGGSGAGMNRMSLAVPMVKAGCPANRPAILDQNAPDVPTAPSKPENPIPVDKR